MITVVDFGSQTAHLIGRRLRQLGIAVEYAYPEEALEQVKKTKPQGIIFSGGPASVYEKGAPTLTAEFFKVGIPILGICYGQQLTGYLLKGKVKPGKVKEYGPAQFKVTKQSRLFKGVTSKPFQVWMSHGDTVMVPPKGFVINGTTKDIDVAAMSDEARDIYCVQFHPEAHHTTHGQEILTNFALICGETLSPLVLSPQKIIKEMKQTVGDKKVICAVSGGVDSTVAAFLIGRAIGKNLIPVYVDSGLMRPETDQRVKHIFTKLIKANLVIVDARKRYLSALKGITDPEVKRKTIGKLYVDIFQEVALKHKTAAFLGQGTIYSDVIESKGSKHASHIKSHHNVGGLPKEMKLTLLEPVRNYYKDEVRELGRLAGLPNEVVEQQPWPGPGYAINIRGEVTEKRLTQVKQADSIVVEEMKNAGLYNQVYECWAVMTGAYSTAVKGDGRVFAEVVGIKSIDSTDVMTSEWTRIPYEVLAKMSSRIVNEVPEVSRVVYDITTKPPATMRWE